MLLCIVIFGRQHPCQYAWALSRGREPVTQGMLHTDDNNQAQVLQRVLRLSSFTVVTPREGKLLGRKGQAALVVQPFFQPAFPLFASCFIIESSRPGKVKILSASAAPTNLKINPYNPYIMMPQWETNLPMALVGMLSHSSMLALDWIVLINTDFIFNVHIQLKSTMGEIPGHVMILFMYSLLNYPRHSWLCHTVTRFLGQGLNICSSCSGLFFSYY